ncbi:MAG: hypothetical protein IPP13_21985 [Kouleothrix sp.]|nr:hypothetical protein [Kouleothrix sp.]
MLSDLERVRRDPAALDAAALLALGTPLHFAAQGVYAAAEALGEPMPTFGTWLTGAPETPPDPAPDAAQAQALLGWLMQRAELLPPRARTALGRDLARITSGMGGALAGLDAAGFVAELGKPGGGRVALVDGLGSVGIAALRAAKENP